jgi:hypothetical protein
MKYTPGHVPDNPQALLEFLRVELNRIADGQGSVLYRTDPVNASLSAGVSANWKVNAGNVVRISTSVTATLTGISVLNPSGRELVLLNVGTGVVVLNSEDAGSSASLRFVLPTTWQLSAGASCTLWYDAQSSRWRGIART